MDLAYQNYGLSGQFEADYDNWDQLFGLGKKAKRRRAARRAKKADRHKVRMERKTSKTDARRADTERVRAETKIMQQMMLSPTKAPVNRKPVTISQTTAKDPVDRPPAQPQKADMTMPMIVLGVLIVGGMMMSRKRQQ